jgi:hypothetical protein
VREASWSARAQRRFVLKRAARNSVSHPNENDFHPAETAVNDETELENSSLTAAAFW